MQALFKISFRIFFVIASGFDEQSFHSKISTEFYIRRNSEQKIMRIYILYLFTIQNLFTNCGCPTTVDTPELWMRWMNLQLPIPM